MTRQSISQTEQRGDDIDAEADDVTQEEVAAWWAQLPDFIKPGYPLHIPPERLPFVQFVFPGVGAPRFCPEPACRRAGECQGGDGPPCFRAGRRDLSQVLFLWWMRAFDDEFSDEEYEDALRCRGNRYGLAKQAPRAKRRTTRR